MTLSEKFPDCDIIHLVQFQFYLRGIDGAKNTCACSGWPQSHEANKSSWPISPRNDFVVAISWRQNRISHSVDKLSEMTTPIVKSLQRSKFIFTSPAEVIRLCRYFFTSLNEVIRPKLPHRYKMNYAKNVYVPFCPKWGGGGRKCTPIHDVINGVIDDVIVIPYIDY